VGDRFYLCENKILCEYDYEERLVFANMATYNSSSLAHIRRQVSRLQVGHSTGPTLYNRLAPRAQTVNASGLCLKFAEPADGGQSENVGRSGFVNKSKYVFLNRFDFLPGKTNVQKCVKPCDSVSFKPFVDVIFVLANVF